MKYMKITRLIAFALIAIILGSYGCILDPKENPEPPPLPEIVWPDLTEKDDCIETILILYNNFNRLNIEQEVNNRYASMLYDDPAEENDYVWNMSQYDIDINHYPAILSRTEDIIGTMRLLENASSMDLKVPATTWLPAPAYCEECYSTTTTYEFTCEIMVNGEPKAFSGSQTEIIFVVGPHHDDPDKWAIYAASDQKQVEN